jgi:hypothetical protein
LAERELTNVVGDALVSLMEWTWPRLRPSARQIFERAAEGVRPDPPISLGFVGWRHPLASPPRHERRPYGDDASLWHQEIDPYRR